MKRALLLGWSSIAAVFLCAVFSPTGAVADQFGAARPAVDYMQPFERLKPLTPLPKQLPFGPRHSSLYRADLAGSVLPGRGYISYRFGIGLARDKVRLNWTVLARVVPISRSGKEIGHPRVQRRHFVTVGEARKASMRLLLSTLPALFRAEIEITDGSGKRLGLYGEYLRTLPPRFQVALHTDAREYSPGDVIPVRLLNLGTETICWRRLRGRSIRRHVVVADAGLSARGGQGNRGWYRCGGCKPLPGDRRRVCRPGGCVSSRQLRLAARRKLGPRTTRGS